MARKLLEIRKKTKSFAVCPNCNKLYDTAAIIPQDTGDSGFK